MITSITVNGYRSLQAFTLGFQSGLNVLVGPNAAGKSNIVSFFYFLRLIAENPLPEAMANAGGAAAVFTKIGNIEYQRSLTAQISGVLPRLNKHYRYTFTIELSQAKNQIYFSSQELSLGVVVREKYKAQQVIALSATLDSEERLAVSARVKGFGRRRGPFTDGQMEEILKQYFRADQSLVTIHRMLPLSEEALLLVSGDLIGTAIFNVIPSSVKAPEDTVRRPGIMPDGSGVAASLHALRLGDLFHAAPGRVFGIRSHSSSKDGREIVSRIIETIKVAVPRIKDITVGSSPFDAQLKCNVEFDGSDGVERLTLPLALVSDGTAKWISIITALFTSKSGISLEEPENFLHPHMQREIVRLMRENCVPDSFVLLTTHSETVLNAVKPSEIVVVSYEEGRTIATRPTNVDLIEEQINQTGFGLGYYYLAQALETQA